MRTILIVEDDHDLADLLRLLLEQTGASVWVAHDLAEARSLERRATSADLALLDINLGAGQPSGLEVEHWLRQSGFRGDVVFLTGHARNNPLVLQAATMPGTRVLAKPIDADQLEQLAGGGH